MNPFGEHKKNFHTETSLDSNKFNCKYKITATEFRKLIALLTFVLARMRQLI